MNKVLVVDAIFRGSRLFYSFLAVKGANMYNYSCDILTRTDYHTEHFDELFSNLQYSEIYPKIIPKSGKWYFKLSLVKVWKVLQVLVNLQKTKHYDFIYFIGMNEFFPWLPFLLVLFPKRLLKSVTILLIEYDIEFIFSHNKEFKKIIKAVLYKLFLKQYRNVRIGILDERIANQLGSGDLPRYLLIPDPALVVEGSVLKDIVVENGNIERIKILIVGMQSSRKGLEDIIHLVRRYPDLDQSVHFKLVGRLDSYSEEYRQFMEAHSHIIEFREGFFSEKEILLEYSETDYVILPYKKSFNSSSGVFAYAMKMAKPVLTSSHGCIGFRVKEYQVGFTYNSENIEELYKVIKELPDMRSEIYKELKGNSIAYATNNSIENHINKIYKAV